VCVAHVSRSRIVAVQMLVSLMPLGDIANQCIPAWVRAHTVWRATLREKRRRRQFPLL
jgi:hypothetical protein